MSSLNQVLEDALQLSSEQQEMLIKILQNRHHENRRAEIAIATDAQKTLAYCQCVNPRNRNRMTLSHGRFKQHAVRAQHCCALTISHN